MGWRVRSRAFLRSLRRDRLRRARADAVLTLWQVGYPHPEGERAGCLAAVFRFKWLVLVVTVVVTSLARELPDQAIGPASNGRSQGPAGSAWDTRSAARARVSSSVGSSAASRKPDAAS